MPQMVGAREEAPQGLPNLSEGHFSERQCHRAGDKDRGPQHRATIGHNIKKERVMSRSSRERSNAVVVWTRLEHGSP